MVCKKTRNVKKKSEKKFAPPIAPLPFIPRKVLNKLNRPGGIIQKLGDVISKTGLEEYMDKRNAQYEAMWKRGK